jgi:hypothetical protein
MSNTIHDHLLRTPYIKPELGDHAPLTVLFSLLSRSDSTPLNERSRAEGYGLDREGQVIVDPAADPSANALERSPNLSFEHWGEYWRKVHGPRFVHVEESDDKSLERLLRYDQLHRFAPGPTSYNAPPYRFPVDEHGKLWPTIVGHVPPYKRPAWDGVAYLNFARMEDMGVVFGNDRIRQKIAPEDHAMFRNIAPILAKQYIILPSNYGNEPVTLVKLHVRKQDATREEFQRWWLHEHAAVVTGHTGGLVKRYVQLHSIGPMEPGELFYHPDACKYDGVSLLNFASLNDLEDFLRSDDYLAISKHEKLMIDTSFGEWWTSIGLTIVNRIIFEKTTSLDDFGTPFDFFKTL